MYPPVTQFETRRRLLDEELRIREQRRQDESPRISARTRLFTGAKAILAGLPLAGRVTPDAGAFAEEPI
jgi:hypothetical protein